MEIQTYSIGYISDYRAMDIISKVGSLAMIGEIGATKDGIADFFEVSSRTVERVLEDNRHDFLKYGDFRKTKKQLKKLGSDKFVGSKIPRKITKINLFNRRQIMLFACYLSQSSDVANRVVQYLIEIESEVSKEDKMNAIFEQLIKWNELPEESRSTIYMQAINAIRESKGLIAFAERVCESDSLVSINDFAKSTYSTLGLGQKNLFKEMRFFGILNSQNKPYQYYINMGYFKAVTRVINGRVIYQPMLTGKGEIWLFNRMKKRLGI